MSNTVTKLCTNNKCKKCETLGLSTTMTCEKHESSDGAHEDLKYTCPHCGYYYWIDGVDA